MVLILVVGCGVPFSLCSQRVSWPALVHFQHSWPAVVVVAVRHCGRGGEEQKQQHAELGFESKRLPYSGLIFLSDTISLFYLICLCDIELDTSSLNGFADDPAFIRFNGLIRPLLRPQGVERGMNTEMISQLPRQANKGNRRSGWKENLPSID